MNPHIEDHIRVLGDSLITNVEEDPPSTGLFSLLVKVGEAYIHALMDEEGRENDHPQGYIDLALAGLAENLDMLADEWKVEEAARVAQREAEAETAREAAARLTERLAHPVKTMVFGLVETTDGQPYKLRHWSSDKTKIMQLMDRLVTDELTGEKTIFSVSGFTVSQGDELSYREQIMAKLNPPLDPLSALIVILDSEYPL